MKIMRINNDVYGQKNHSNFKGLWGQPKEKTTVDPVLYVPKIYTTYYYYPFTGESVETIKENTEKINHAEFKKENGQTKYYVRECKICADINATKEEYEKYINISNPEDVTEEVLEFHETLKGKLQDCPLDVQNPRNAQNVFVPFAHLF